MLTCIIWVLFACFLIKQHNLIWMYLDDYGYASLNYDVSVGTIGNDYSFLNILEYAYKHYMHWGGRVLFYSIAIVVYHYLGLAGMRLFQGAIVFLIFYCLYRFSTECKEGSLNFINVLFVCTLYGVFTLGIVQYGLYWFSASSGYVWPILTLLTATYLTIKMIQSEEKRIVRWLGLGMLWFVASFSYEQIAVAAVVIVICLMVYGYKRYQMLLIEVFFSLAGAGIMLGAPGNWKRMGNGMSLFEQIGYNVPYLFQYIFSEEMLLFLLLAFSTFFIVAVNMVMEEKLKPVLKRIVFIIAIFFGLIFSVLLVKQPIIGAYSVYVQVLVGVMIFAGVFLTGFYLVQKNKVFAFLCMIGGIFCYGAMAVVPSIPIRIVIPFIFMLLPAIITIAADTFKVWKHLFLYVPICVLLLSNICEIYAGYNINNTVLAENNNKILLVKEKIENNEAVENVELTKVFYEEYAGPLTYMEGYEWGDVLLRKYYALPETFEFVWKEAYHINEIWVTKDTDGNVFLDEQHNIACGVTMSAFAGDEEVYVNGTRVEIVKGEEFISFLVSQELVENGCIEVKICSDKYGEARELLTMD